MLAFFFIIMGLNMAFASDSENVAEAYRILRLEASLHPTPRDINAAYKDLIGRFVSSVMEGEPAAIRQSQQIARARYLLLHSDKDHCPALLAALPPKSKKEEPPPAPSESNQRINFLHALEPDLFPAAIDPFRQESLDELVPQLAAAPAKVIETLLLNEKILRQRFPNDATISLIGAYQRTVAHNLSNYLRQNRISRPDLINGFEVVLLKKVMTAHDDTGELLQLMSAITDLSLPPGRPLFAVISLLDDSRPMVRAAASALLLQVAGIYGWPPVFEGELKHVRNVAVLRVLLASRKPLMDDSYQYIIHRLPEMTNPAELGSVIRDLFRLNLFDAQIIHGLKILRDGAQFERMSRFVASEELIDYGQDIAPSVDFIIQQIPSATGDEMFQVTNWCLGSSRCPSTVHAALDGVRVPQRHQH